MHCSRSCHPKIGISSVIHCPHTYTMHCCLMPNVHCFAFVHRSTTGHSQTMWQRSLSTSSNVPTSWSPLCKSRHATLIITSAGSWTSTMPNLSNNLPQSSQQYLVCKLSFGLDPNAKYNHVHQHVIYYPYPLSHTLSNTLFPLILLFLHSLLTSSTATDGSLCCPNLRR